MSVRRRRPTQLALAFPNTWGGKRKGAGRKPTRAGGRPGVPHRPRPAHRSAHPVHVTLRAREGLPPFREQALFGCIRDAIRATARSPRLKHAFRVVHFSVQYDHLHLIVEAADSDMLARGMKGLGIRVARAINRLLDTHGQVIGERFHSHELMTPREVRNALVYVLMNIRKHARRVAAQPARVDELSSAPWFDGFRQSIGPPPPELGERPVVASKTWLLSTGWRRRGLIDLGESPRTPGAP